MTEAIDWLGRQDSNLGMAVPKTAALPLGDAPMPFAVRLFLVVATAAGNSHLAQGRRMIAGRHSPLAGHPAAGYKSGLPDDFENVGV